jgi:magnesium chelatase subunit D
MGTGDGGEKKENPNGSESPDQLFPVGPTFSVKKLAPASDQLMRRGSGRRLRTRTSQKQGRYVRSRIASECKDLALDATLRAAAPFQLRRREGSRTAVVILKKDWREKVREKRIGSFILFIVDASGSMGSRGRMAASKGAVMSLLLDAYQKRDRVAMVTFRRHEATILLPPTASIEVAARLLNELPIGGRTPLSAGLAKGYEILLVQMRREPNLRPLAVLITDGKSNVPLGGEMSPMEEVLRVAERLGRDARVHWIVVDTEEAGIVRFELARHIARVLGGEYFRIDDLRAADLVNVLKGRI